LYRFSNDRSLSTKGTANYVRNELATALRKGPYNCNLLLGGYDEKKGPELYYIDYMASMQKVKYGAHGYGSYFSFSILDKYYEDDIDLDTGKKLMGYCIAEIKKRLLLNSPAFIIKVVNKDGVSIIDKL